MARQRGFPVIVATDGSAAARAALATAVVFPWPAGARALAVVARRVPALAGRPGYVVAAFDRGFSSAAAHARRTLARRWPAADAVIVDERPVEAILHAARRARARAIVVGSRGAGAFRRLLVGSVARGVVRDAPCAVLVAKRRRAAVRRLVLGVDGSAEARRAADMVARLATPRGRRVTVVRVVEPMSLPSLGLMPGRVRTALAAELAALNAGRRARARRDAERTAARLRRAGWAARAAVRAGAPLGELLATVKAARADLLVVGTRGAGGLERLVLGSVAEGALSRCPVPILVVR